MNSELLLAAFRKYEGSYEILLNTVKIQTHSTRWGQGALDPFTVEPYRIELLGGKPGRMLKGQSAPAKNRYLYSYDIEGRVVHMMNFAEMGGPPGKKDWIHFDDFYIYDNEGLFRLAFGSVLGDRLDARLSKVVRIDIFGKRVVATHSLSPRASQFLESTTYQYLDDGSVSINCTWPEGPYPSREYLVEEGGERVFDLTEGIREQIYP